LPLPYWGKVISYNLNKKEVKMAQISRPYSTVEEYLWEEERAESKHEYYNGQVYNMAGGSPEHSALAVNLTAELRAGLRGRDCQVFNSDLKIAVAGDPRTKGQKRRQTDEFITYPDASVFCGQLEFYKNDRQTLVNPTALFEVLSPSTRNYDRSTKLEQYRKIPGLMTYIMLDSARVWVEQYYRASSDSWQVDTPLEDLTASLHLKALEIIIPLTALYEGISLEVEVDGPENE